ncbi:MAG: hypothetical protein WAM58_00650 [Candidatus Acidiferrum sp.]
MGDFLTISIDSTTATITYNDLSNGQSGTVPYTVGTNGTYTITDPQGNLLAAYELSGYALLIEAAKVGPNQNTPALITAVEKGPVSLANLAGKNYNYIQFRTTQGGLNVGNVSIDANGDITHDSYSPVDLIEPANIPLSDPCFGLFTVRIASATSLQDLFVSFQGNAAIFASFQSALPAAPTNPYTYFYGVGLK